MKSSERHVQTLFQCLKNLFKCLNMDLGPVPITLIAKAKVNSMCSTTYFSHKRAAWVLLGNLSEKALAFAKDILAILHWNMSEERSAGVG